MNLREFTLEDRTSAAKGGGEMDEYVLNSDVASDRLNISWDVRLSL